MKTPWDAILIHLLAVIAATLSFIASLLNNKKIEKLHKHVNSRMSQLIKAARERGHMAGMKEQRDRDKKTGG